MHVVLSSVPGGVLLTPLTDDGDAIPADDAAAPLRAPTTVPRAALSAFVASLEQHHPRWVWDDTAAWYPALLTDGVRVERCVDLRLNHTILRNSARTATSELARAGFGPWDVAAATAQTPAPQAALFDLRK